MIGVIPRILSDLIIDKTNEQTLQSIFKAANIPSDRNYHSSQYYDDSEWQNFYEQTKEKLNITEQEASTLYAEAFMIYALKNFPTWFDMAKSAYDFLCLQPTIHNSFASGLVDSEKRKAVIDKFRLEKHPGHLIIHYRSPNKLCSIYTALAQGVLQHYGEKASISQCKCMKNGDSECEIHVKWK